MAKLAGKGSVLKQTISSVLTAVAQIFEISTSGTEVETFDNTCLDTSGAGKTYQPTGYAEPGTVEWGLFFDPDLAGHQALTDDITTPPASRVYSLTMTDATPFEEQFTVAGIGMGRTIAMNDGIKANFTAQLSGLPTYNT